MRKDFQLVPQLISVGEFYDLLQFDNCGAEAVFKGVVRQTNNTKTVTQLDFEAYPLMVYEQLHQIADQLRDRFDIRVIALHHRLGSVAPGDTAVLAGISSPHRHDAFSALIELMNELKRKVPIWKKEVYVDGHAWLSPTP